MNENAKSIGINLYNKRERRENKAFVKERERERERERNMCMF
jgi:hypothetical protein